MSLHFHFRAFAGVICLFLLAPWTVMAQCDEPPATNTCEEAPILCSFDDIDGFCTTTKPFNNFMAPSPLCPQGGSPHNPFWFAFYAGCTNLQVTINPTNCGNEGVQAAIYGYGGDGLCTGSQDQPAEFIACYTLPCFNTPQTLNAQNLTIGQIYYLMIDGCSGDTCTIYIDLVGNCGPPAIGPWQDSITGPSPICATGTGTYSVEEPEGGTIFHWYVDGNLVTEGGSNSADITWGAPGTYELCVDVSNQCVDEFDAPSQFCRSVTVVEVVPVNPPPVTICADETYTYAGVSYPPGVHSVTLTSPPYDCDSIVTLTVNGFVVTNAVNPPPVTICDDETYLYAGFDLAPGLHDITLDNYLGCDSVVTVEVIPDPHVSADLGTFYMCLDDKISIGGQNWPGDPPGAKEITIAKANPPQCDSTIRFLIETMSVEAYLFEPEVLGCFIEQTMLDGSNSGFYPLNGELAYQWSAYDGGVLGDPSDGPTMWVQDPGKYCLDITITSPDGLFSCSDSACVVVTTKPEPDASASVSNVLTCYEPLATLTGKSMTPGVTFQWIDPQGKVIGTDSIVLVSLPGLYQFVVTDNTGCPNSAAVVVTANQTRPGASAIGDTLTCYQPQGDLVGSSPTPGVTFAWKDAAGQVFSTDSLAIAPGPGTFLFEVTDPSNGCRDSAFVTVVVDQSAPVPTASTDTLTCLLPKPPLNGGSNVPGAIYSWSFGGQSYSQAKDTVASKAGTYTLTVLDPSNGCSADTAITVPEDTALPDVQVAGDTVDCLQTVATLTGNSATSGVTFTWLFGGNPVGSGKTLTASQPGTYTLRVTGPNGCMDAVDVALVPDFNLPNLTTSATDDTLTCVVTLIGLSGSADVAVSFAWTAQGGQPLGASPMLEVAKPGAYILTVTAANGCTASDTLSIAQDTLSPVITLAQGGVIDCIASAISLKASSPSVGVTYQWFTPGGSPLTPGPAPSVSSPGTYRLVVSTPNGCTAEALAQVTASPDLPQGVVASDDGPLTCDKTSVTIGVSSSTPGVSFQWAGPGAFSGTAPTAQVLLPGTYSVTVTNPANGCTVTDLTVVSIDTVKPQLSGVGAQITCAQPTVGISVNLLNPVGGATYSYDWKDPGNQSIGGNASAIQAGQSGNWNVQVENEQNGCMGMALVAVTENTAKPAVSVSVSGKLTCVVSQVTAAASSAPGMQYAWSGPGIDASNKNLAAPVVTLPGSYALTVTDPVNGCSSLASAVVLEDRMSPQVSMSGDTLDCNDPTTTLQAQIVPAAGISVQWTLNGNAYPGAGPSIPVNQAGQYALMVTNTANGCTSIAQATVSSDFQAPDLSTQGCELTCLEPKLRVTAQSATPGVSFLWSGPGGFSSPGPDPEVTVAGSYTVVATAPNGCTASATVQVTEKKEFPTAAASSSNVLDCTNTTTILSAAGSSSGANFTYGWSDPGGTPLGSGGTLPGVGQPGLYTLTVTNVQNGCTAEAVVEVKVNPNVPTAMSLSYAGPRCHGDRNGTIVIGGVTGGTPPFLYSLNGGPFTASAQFAGLGAGNYTVTLQDAAGCLLEAPALILEDPPKLSVSLGPDILLTWGRDTLLAALVEPPGAVLASISWTPAGIDTTLNSRQLRVSPYNQTLYGVVVTDTAGCRAEDRLLVVVEKDRPVYIPNVFHPGGAENIRFFVQAGPGVKQVELMEVFDRWGERVFTAEGIPPNQSDLGWDGAVRGTPANPGVFVYYALIRFDDGITILYKGDVTLLR